MAAITAQMVKELRDKTDAGMGDCKKALVQTNGDMEAAVEYLRKSGIAKSENRQDRATKEGMVYVHCDGHKAVMLEILCETDFVAKNEKFIAYVEGAAKRIFDATSGNGDVTGKAREMESDELGALFAKFGEKMILNRALRLESANTIASYVYNGKIGLLTEVSGEFDEAILKQLCMHIVAYKPMFIRQSEVPAEAVAKEKEIGAAQITAKFAEEGKTVNDKMMENILRGKINKWYSEVCLEEQPWMFDEKSSLKKLYPKLHVEKFIRWICGE